MATVSKKQTNPIISDFSHQELLNEIGRQYKNLSTTVTKASKDAHKCYKALNTIADDLCPVVCSSLTASYSGFKSSAVKVSDNAVVSALKPVETKFNKYCADKYSCNYQDKDAGFVVKEGSEPSSTDACDVADQGCHGGGTAMAGEVQEESGDQI